MPNCKPGIGIDEGDRNGTCGSHPVRSERQVLRPGSHRRITALGRARLQFLGEFQAKLSLEQLRELYKEQLPVIKRGNLILLFRGYSQRSAETWASP